MSSSKTLGQARILAVDDEPAILEALKQLLAGHFEADSATSAEDAMRCLEEREYGVVLCDLSMPGMGGEALLAQLRQRWPEIKVLVVSAGRDLETAVRCMKQGAFDYLCKPWNADLLLQGLGRASDHWALARENVRLREAQRSPEAPELLGSSAAMAVLRELIAKVAQRDITVHIQGESGSGKELVARAIHQKSSRAEGPFVPIACAAIPADLLESELFGHEKGAFSSAIQQRVGKFEYASGGTLFLDDVATLPEAAQAKLLRVLEARELTRLGSNRAVAIDVRVLSSSNQALDKLVKAGRFREDLYWRLVGVPILVPPLRERGDDVGALFEFFIAQRAKSEGRPTPKLLPAVLERLRQHSFPGNVRELKHLADAAWVLSPDGEISMQSLPLRMLAPLGEHQLAPQALKEAVREFERQVILKALREAHGNQTRAAAQLGVHRNTLLQKMGEFEINLKKTY